MKLKEVFNNIEGACRNMTATRSVIRDKVQSFSSQIDGIAAKLDERKTVHEWLNQKGIPKEELTGKPMCLLRRLAVALEIQPYLTHE